ncbi:major facilitator superfamily domain-containing protein [Aspergillus stella-maris]|uniref:major facilitator superfamily domain-containing protein n=1 Tax=Aspergillus stella-maris TaxID=1810926 RepID=UPI003CCD4D8A
MPPDQCSGLREEEDADAVSDIPESTRRRLIITLVFILLAVETGGQMIPGPMVRVIEGIACDSYWRVHGPEKLPGHGPIPEHWCNLPAVQTEVANVKGYSDLFEGLLSTLCAIPYGQFADRHGRRISIRLTVPGFVLNGLITISVLWFHGIFPLRAIWFASCSWIIGGGPTVTLAIIWTMLADLTVDSDRAVLFFRVGLASQIAGFVASAVSSGLMAINPWVPLLVGCGTVIVGLGAAWALPETINIVKARSGSEIGRQDHTTRREESWFITTPPKYSFLRKIKCFIHPYLFIFTPCLLSLLFSFTFYQVALGSSSFLTQYISTRFSWTLAKAQLLSSLHSLITIPVFAFLIPHLTNKTFHLLTPPKKDLYIASLSIMSLSVGCLGIGLSPVIYLTVPSLCIHALGAGFPLAARSLVTAFVGRDETAKLYAVVEVMQSLGTVLGSLVATNAFEVGLSIGGVYVGLAYVLTITLRRLSSGNPSNLFDFRSYLI